jgi:5'-methylthioadenosine phosphorylase
MIGIIGGTGFYNANFLENVEEITVETAYGDREINLGLIEEEKVVFLPRHGPTHSIPPHMVDYRKNIQALKNSGAKRLISINSVGSIDKSITPGSILLPHDFIDLTWGRNSTFYDNEVVHTDMTNPFCEEMRKTIFKCASKFNDKVIEKGVYACTQGPRFETHSEVKMVKRLGGDVVGMVGCPEVALAREAGLCYASICTVVNLGSGISETPLNLEEVKSILDAKHDALRSTVICSIKEMPEKRSCRCHDSK